MVYNIAPKESLKAGKGLIYLKNIKNKVALLYCLHYNK